MRLARHELEIEVDDGRHCAGSRVVGNGQIAALEDGKLIGHDWILPLQSLRLISRNPSAIRLKPRIRLETDSAGMSSMYENRHSIATFVDSLIMRPQSGSGGCRP